jgi:hypothetical protein
MSSADLETAGPSGRQQTANGNPAEHPAEMAVETAAEQPGTSMRVLALYCTSGSVPEQDQGFDPPDAPNINHLAARSGIEVGSQLLSLKSCSPCQQLLPSTALLAQQPTTPTCSSATPTYLVWSAAAA